MQQHFAESGPFMSQSTNTAGPQPVHVARQAESYAVAVDTHGKLRWAEDNIDGDHLICVVSEETPEDYLPYRADRAFLTSSRESVQFTSEAPRGIRQELRHPHASA
jgi:hypothetical protein